MISLMSVSNNLCHVNQLKHESMCSDDSNGSDYSLSDIEDGLNELPVFETSDVFPVATDGNKSTPGLWIRTKHESFSEETCSALHKPKKKLQPSEMKTIPRARSKSSGTVLDQVSSSSTNGHVITIEAGDTLRKMKHYQLAMLAYRQSKKQEEEDPKPKEKINSPREIFERVSIFDACKNSSESHDRNSVTSQQSSTSHEDKPTINGYYHPTNLNKTKSQLMGENVLTLDYRSLVRTGKADSDWRTLRGSFRHKRADVIDSDITDIDALIETSDCDVSKKLTWSSYGSDCISSDTGKPEYIVSTFGSSYPTKPPEQILKSSNNLRSCSRIQSRLPPSRTDDVRRARKLLAKQRHLNLPPQPTINNVIKDSSDEFEFPKPPDFHSLPKKSYRRMQMMTSHRSTSPFYNCNPDSVVRKCFKSDRQPPNKQKSRVSGDDDAKRSSSLMVALQIAKGDLRPISRDHDSDYVDYDEFYGSKPRSREHRQRDLNLAKLRSAFNGPRVTSSKPSRRIHDVIDSLKSISDPQTPMLNVNSSNSNFSSLPRPPHPHRVSGWANKLRKSMSKWKLYHHDNANSVNASRVSQVSVPLTSGVCDASYELKLSKELSSPEHSWNLISEFISSKKAQKVERRFATLPSTHKSMLKNGDIILEVDKSAGSLTFDLIYSGHHIWQVSVFISPLSDSFPNQVIYLRVFLELSRDFYINIYYS